MDAKEIANRALDNMAVKAIKGGAKPFSVLYELAGIQDIMRESYREGDIGSAIGYAMGIAKRAQSERDAIDTKWTTRLQQGEVTESPFEDPESMEDFVNIRALDKWLAAYSPDGENMRVLRYFEQDVRKGELKYLNPE